MSHPFHPVSEIFPLMIGARFDELVADIKANGLLVPIWRYDGQIIDGRNRYNACLSAGVEPAFQEWDGNGDLTKFVVSLNLHRRQLNESQRGMIAGKLANLPNGCHKNYHKNAAGSIEPAVVTPDVPHVTLDEAAELLNVSRASVKRAKKVRLQGAPDLVAAVEAGEISLHAAVQVANLPHDDQKAAISDRTKIPRPPTRPATSNGIVPKTKTTTGRKAPAAIRGAIGTLVGLATGLDSFTVKDAAPSADEAEQWERDLAVVISAINRFRRQLKEHVHV